MTCTRLLIVPGVVNGHGPPRPDRRWVRPASSFCPHWGATGGYVGGILDRQLFGSETPDQTVYGARIQDLRVQSSSYGSVIPLLYGKGRLAWNVIWIRSFDEEVRTEIQTVDGGGKGG